MANKQKTWAEAIKTVLEEAGEPLHYTDIAYQIIDQEIRTDFGATPAQTVISEIIRAMKGKASPFVRIERGVYGLANTKSVIKEPQDDDVKELGSIEAFGVKWKRNKVYWARDIKIFGRTHPAASKVNIADQQGVYLLHDENGEVVYVGQGEKIGSRLFEHTRNALTSRWERFSWFGIQPVNSNGELEAVKEAKITPAELITTLEALLIEVLEPRKNRKKTLAIQEYMQAEDGRKLP